MKRTSLWKRSKRFSKKLFPVLLVLLILGSMLPVKEASAATQYYYDRYGITTNGYEEVTTGYGGPLAYEPPYGGATGYSFDSVSGNFYCNYSGSSWSSTVYECNGQSMKAHYPNGSNSTSYTNYGASPKEGRGALLESNIIADDGTYPADGKQGTFWYVKKGAVPPPPPPNQPPGPPDPFTKPTGTSLEGNKALSVSWGYASDPEGDYINYYLSASVNGGSWEDVYGGGNVSASYTAPKTATSVKFRVRATDSKGASSGYTTSKTYNVNNNTAPNAPGNFTSPIKDLNAGEKTDINWGISTDPDGLNKYYYSRYGMNQTWKESPWALISDVVVDKMYPHFDSSSWKIWRSTGYLLDQSTGLFVLTPQSPWTETPRLGSSVNSKGVSYSNSPMNNSGDYSPSKKIYKIEAWYENNGDLHYQRFERTSYTGYDIGALIDSNTVANDGTYPSNGQHTDGYWYMRGGLQSGVTINYDLDVEYNSSGTWETVESGMTINQKLNWTATTDTTKKTFRFRVRAKDNMNEYSGYTYSDTLNIIHDKQPPVIGSIQGHQNTNSKDSIPVSIYGVTDQTGVDRVEVYSKKTNEPSFILHGLATKVGTDSYRYTVPNRGEGLYTVQFVPVDTLGNVTYGFQPNYETTFRVDYTLPTFTEMRLTGSNYLDGTNHWIKENQPFRVNLRGTDVSGFSKLKNSLVGIETNTDTAFVNYDNLLNTNTKGGTRTSLTVGDTTRVINQDETTETETDYTSKEAITNIQRYKLQYSLTDKATNTIEDTDSGISLNIDGEEPTIKNGTTIVQIVNKPKFIVEVDGINDGEGSGIKDVVMPTWSSKDDQDDLKKPWLTNKEYLSTKTGDEKYQLDVDIKDHGDEEGKYETNVNPVDNVGNKANVKTVITYVDLTKPVVTDNNPTEWVKGPFNLKLTLADSLTGVRAVSCDCGKTINFEKTGEVYPTLKEVDYEVSENRDYTFTITDGAGNETTHTVKVQFLDNDGPTIEADPDKKAPTTKAVKVNVTVTDGESGTEDGLSSKDYVLNEFDEAPKTASTAWQPLGSEYTLDKAGTWFLHVKAIDRVGNQTIKTFGPYTIRFDAQSPDIFVEIEKGREFLEFGKKEFDVEFKAIDDMDEASKLKFEYSTDMVNWSDPISFTADGVVSRTLDVPNGLSRGDAVTVFARVKDTVGNYTIIDDKIIYGKDTYIEDGNTIGETVEFAGRSWIYVGGYKLVTKAPVSNDQPFSTGTSDFSTTATGNIGRYLNTTFLKSLEDNLEPKDFEHIELFNWQNGNSRVAGKVGLMTEEEYRNVNHIFTVATNAMTITKGSSANNIRIARPDGKTGDGSTTTSYAVHPAIKLKSGTMIVEGKIKYTKDMNSVMEKINQIENKMIAVKSVQSLNRLTSRVDNKIELAITKEPGISLEVVAGNLPRKLMTFTGNKLIINIKDVPSAYIPEYIEVYGFTDRDGNGRNEEYEFVSSKKIFRKDFFFESSDVD